MTSIENFTIKSLSKYTDEQLFKLIIDLPLKDALTVLQLVREYDEVFGRYFEKTVEKRKDENIVKEELINQ